MWILTNPHYFLTMSTWDVLGVNANRMKIFLKKKKDDVRMTYFCWSNRKLPRCEKPHAKTAAWSYDMERSAQKCVERYCELANKKVKQLYKVSTPCLDDHQFKQEEFESVGQLFEACSQIVLKCLYLARIG